jgi:hypothetical protein
VYGVSPDFDLRAETASTMLRSGTTHRSSGESHYLIQEIALNPDIT